jgi:hypothetical protein
VRIDRAAVRNVAIALATGAFVLVLAWVGRAINAGLVALIGDTVLTQVNLAIATVILDHAIAAFLVVATVSFLLGVIENRRDRDRPGP